MRQPNRAGRIAARLFLVFLALATFFTVFGASMIPFHFRAGKPAIFLPFKMIMPAFAWDLCWFAALCSLAAFVLAWLFWRARRRLAIACALSLLIAVANAVSCAMAAGYISRVTASHDADFTRAFGPGWQTRIAAEPAGPMLAHRWSPFAFHDPQGPVERNVVFWTIPGAGRKLLADIWLPPAGVRPTGLAFIYLHGSAWTMADKGWGTDPMFRHLAAQGYVGMDVAYRLAPETDLFGMVADAQRAIAWMKANASRYRVDPARIVIAGASAGGQIALLAAYAYGQPQFTPPDLAGIDTSVRAVVSEYGPVSMGTYAESEVGKFTSTGIPARQKKVLTDPKTHMPNGPMPLEQVLENVLGGMPNEVPRAYELTDARSYVSPRDPPTLLMQGEFDSVATIKETRSLASGLCAARVPVVLIAFPDTDHGFDVFTSYGARFGIHFPFDSNFAPPTQAALYYLDRFLALMN
ncbi:MAG: alpha/beta hydrolase fold domain-containing protein [Bryobacteraceae bacterium]